MKGEYVPSWDPDCKHQKPKKVEGNVSKLLGCYHMKYYFKSQLIAVGVVDMTNSGLSSVYFFYDPKYK
jgi:arginyl-tRNA--protein-N-Asp/Glu arginylyltransferase